MENVTLKMILNLEIICKPNSKRTRIFGVKFVKNNRDKCKIIYNFKKHDLKEYYEEFDNLDLLNLK